MVEQKLHRTKVKGSSLVHATDSRRVKNGKSYVKEFRIGLKSLAVQAQRKKLFTAIIYEYLC